jgi:hypothetical protein
VRVAMFAKNFQLSSIDVKRAPMILFVVIFDLLQMSAGQQFSLISVAFLHEKLLN